MPVYSQLTAVQVAAQSADIAEWLGEITWASAGGSTTNLILRQNADGTVTRLNGAFVLDEGEPVSGTITSMQRYDGLEEWENITGLNVDLSLFQAYLGNGLLLGGFLFSGSDTFVMKASGSVVFAFEGNDDVDLAQDGTVYAAGGNDDIDALNVAGSDNDTVDYALNADGSVNTRGMNITLNTNNAQYEYAATGVAQDKATLGIVETDQLRGINHVSATFGDDSVVGNIWFDIFDDPVASSVWTYDGDDTISRAGNVWAGRGNDTIVLPVTAGGIFRGESGDDLFRLSATGSEQEADIRGGSGKDTIDASMSFSFYIDLVLGVVYLSGGGSGAIGTISFSNIENVNGAGLGDTLIGIDGKNVLDGKGGDDLLVGAAGADQLIGGNGADELRGDSLTGIAIVNANDMGDDVLDGGGGFDKLYGDGGADQLLGGDGGDELHGEDGADRLEGQNGGDTLNGGNGSDMLFGQSGDDILSGGNGADDLKGGAGADELSGGRVNDRLWGGSDDDVLWGNQGKDYLNGGAGADDLRGGTHNDKLYGKAGNDSLRGGYGADRLDGGDGNDELRGQQGADKLVFGRDYGQDQLFDFDDDLDTILFKQNLGVAGLTSQQIIDQFAAVSGGHTVFDFGGGDVFTVRSVTDLSTLANDIGVI